MKIIVTGGSGFIGSHLVDVLLENGYEVLIYDLENPLYGQKCNSVTGNVNDFEKFLNVSRDCDYIFHLAAEANINNFFNSPIESNLSTSNSTLTVLECARRNNIKRVLLASTEWVYGSTDSVKSSEMITEDTPFSQNPDHLYTTSKISAELFCKNYLNLYGVNYTIMRYGIPFGERAREATVTPIFINKLLNKEEISIHGDGSQTRQFIYVKDLAEGNFTCLNETAKNQILNINGREQISVIQIVRTLEDLLNIEAKIKFIEDRKGNYKGRYISSEKAEKLLGWKPKYSYREAMKIYLEKYLQSVK